MGGQGLHRQHHHFRKGYVAQDAAVSTGKRMHFSFWSRDILQEKQFPIAKIEVSVDVLQSIQKVKDSRKPRYPTDPIINIPAPLYDSRPSPDCNLSFP